VCVICFDGVNKHILVEYDVDEASVVLDIIDVYSAWKRWVRTDDNGKFLQAFYSTGGEPQGGNEYAGRSVYMLNGWTFAPETTVQLSSLVINGNLFPEPETNPTLMFDHLLAGYSLAYKLRTSTLPVLLVTNGGGGGGDAPTVDQIAAKLERTGGPIDLILKNTAVIPAGA
jgi:hypothetical protein